jgi:putative MATE family efflux protein
VTSEEKFVQMTETPVRKLVIKLAVPTVFTMLVTAFYNTADTYFVGGLGTQQTGAVGVVFSIMAILQAFSFFFGHGSGNFVSRKLGAKKMDEAKTMASTGFSTAIIVGIVIAIVGNIFAPWIAKMLGATPTILPYAVDYLRFILLGAPFIMGSFVQNNLLRFQGSAFYGMIGMVSGGVMNLILDPILIYGFHMGVMGAGMATMISQIVSFFILFAMNNKVSCVPFRFSNIHPSFRLYAEVVRGGLPSLARQGLASLSVICLNHIAGGYGDAAIAAMSIVSRVSVIAFSAVIGIGQGFQPVVGFNYGARKKKRVKDAYRFTTVVTSVFLLFVAAAGFIFSKQIIHCFRKDDIDVINIGAQALKYQCLTLPFMGFITMSNMMAQTMGLAFRATLMSMYRQFIFFLPALFTLTFYFGLTGLEISQPIADVFSVACTIPIVISIMRINLSEKSKEISK